MIVKAQKKHADFLSQMDIHISKERLIKKTENSEIFIAIENDNIIGFLRYGFFWDQYPFMNMLYIEETCRGNGVGKQLVQHWESNMKEEGYNLVMTSTLSNEQAQNFYRKLNYHDIGGFIMPNDPLEVILIKEL